MNDAGNPFGTRGQYSQDRHQIRAVLHVDDSTDKVRRAGRQFRLALDLAAHVADEGYDDFIALRRVLAKAGAADGPAQGPCREPEGGLRVIPFDGVRSRPVGLIAGDAVRTVPFFIDDDAVLAQAIDGHVDVARRFQRRRAAKARIAVEEGQGHEQARKN